jgi:hypothetical protein
MVEDEYGRLAALDRSVPGLTPDATPEGAREPERASETPPVSARQETDDTTTPVRPEGMSEDTYAELRALTQRLGMSDADAAAFIWGEGG